MSNIVNYSDIMAFHPGYYVAEIVEDMGITQDEFAKQMGVSRQTIISIEKGKYNPSILLAFKIANHFGKSIEEIFIYEEEEDE